MKIKTITTALIILAITTPAYCMSGTTVGGQIACTQKGWYNDMVQFVAAEDKESFKNYINRKRCVILKKGLHVTVTDSPGMFGGTTGFVFHGYKFWTAREAITYGR